ncbi:MAG: DUF4136 domain-containing protein [Verrucomicrobiota bacterium]
MKKNSLLFVPLLLILAGCATHPTAQFESDPEADITSYATFGLMPLPTDVDGVDPGTLMRLGPAVTKATKESLVSKGYTETTLEEADFSVAVTGKVVPQVEVTDWGYDPFYTYPRAGRWGRYHPYYGSSRNIDIDEYDEGTLIVQLYDASSKKMVWVGWITAKSFSSKLPTEEAVDARIREILANFPAK